MLVPMVPTPSEVARPTLPVIFNLPTTGVTEKIGAVFAGI
jgi:hypothetical protein